MAGGKVYAGSNLNLLIQNERLPCSPEVLESLWMPSFSPAFDGSKSMLNFENVHGGHPTERPFFHSLEKEDNGDEDYDGCFHPPGKKRRLTADQVQFLERNFEVENKLEPERKGQLAKELSLQPRQVAIWFQNRRARFKTKQLEKDYDSLKASYDSLKADYDNLFKEKDKMKNEVLLLKDKLLIREKEKEHSEPPNSINSPRTEPLKQIPNTIHENASNVPMVVCKQEDASSAKMVCKQEDASSAKSDVFDSESPNYADGNHSSLLEPADSSQVFGPDQSDFSQDEEENFSKSLFHPPCFPKLEDGCYHDPPANSCNFGFPVEDQPFYVWPY